MADNCPRCGGTKRDGFAVCWQCWQSEPAGTPADVPAHLPDPPITQYDRCWECDAVQPGKYAGPGPPVTVIAYTRCNRGDCDTLVAQTAGRGYEAVDVAEREIEAFYKSGLSVDEIQSATRQTSSEITGRASVWSDDAIERVIGRLERRTPHPTPYELLAKRLTS